MTRLETAAPARKPRRDGWTPIRRAALLACLSAVPDVRRACAAIGMSRQSAYRLRGRDPDFAAAWDDALRDGHAAMRRSFIEGLPEALRRTLSGSSNSCNLQP